MSWLEPDDDYMTSEQAAEAGYLFPDDAEELRELLKFVDIPDEPTRGLAAIVLMEQVLTPQALQAGSEAQALYEWAKVKLNRHVLA